eukprot:gene13425-14190_t
MSDPEDGYTTASSTSSDGLIEQEEEETQFDGFDAPEPVPAAPPKKKTKKQKKKKKKKSKKEKKASAAPPIEDQPRLSNGLRGRPEEGVRFAVHCSKEKHVAGSVSTKIRSTRKDVSTLRNGYWVTIRDGTAEGEHIIEVRTRVHAESFFEDACPCPDEIPVNLCLHLICSAAGIGDSPESVVADCLCAALCSGNDDDSAPSAGAVSVDGFTTWVISTKDISWIETGEEKITASLQSRKGPCSCFAACFTNSGGNDDDDDDESSCCKCCEYEFNDVTKSLKSKSMTIHTNVGTSIPINWDAQNTAIASEKLDCCNPSIQRKSTEEIDYDDDGTVITTVRTSEHREPPTFPGLGACCYRKRKEKRYTTVHKYLMDDAYKDKCETKGEDLTSLAKMLMNLMVEDT